MELIRKYFPDISEHQAKQLDRTGELIKEWNSKINVISRKDTDHIEERHILHSLGIARFTTFKPGTTILDVGTGGGFPGIPLAILFPEVQFTLVDSIGKKIKVVKAVCEDLELKNTVAVNARAEDVPGEFDFVVSRAVTHLVNFFPWVARKIRKQGFNAQPNGIIGLKGGDLHEEIEAFEKKFPDWAVLTTDLSVYFSEEFFATKKVISVYRA